MKLPAVSKLKLHFDAFSVSDVVVDVVRFHLHTAQLDRFLCQKRPIVDGNETAIIPKLN